MHIRFEFVIYPCNKFNNRAGKAISRQKKNIDDIGFNIGWIVNSFLDNFFKGDHYILHWCQVS